MTEPKKPLDMPEQQPPTNKPAGSPLREFERRERQRGLLLGALRASFLVLIVATVALTLASAQTTYGGVPVLEILGTLLAAIAAACLVVIADIMTPRKHLNSVLGIYIGVSFGLVAALGLSALIDIVVEAWEIKGKETAVFLGLAKGIGGLSLVYLSVSIVLSTKDDFRIIIPYVQFEKRAQGVLPLLLDTSALVDGRIVDLARTGIIDSQIMIERFVIDELQALSDSHDRLKRDRGRRGLDVVRRLQEIYGETKINDTPTTETTVDRKLIQTAQREGYRIVTTDGALAKIAEIQDIPVLNVNEVAGAMRLNVLPGDTIDVEIVREGDTAGQGVAFLPDGTMIVIDDASNRIGETLSVVITNSLQRAGGRLVFGRLNEGGEGSGGSADMARAALKQPPMHERPDKGSPSQGQSIPRNPRRNG
jgi:uncharacterized protein YacL